jgi:hypothetical protein
MFIAVSKEHSLFMVFVVRTFPPALAGGFPAVRWNCALERDDTWSHHNFNEKRLGTRGKRAAAG